jgi:hypothetical protein
MKHITARFEIFFLSLIIILAFVLRMYRITNPIADWHSFRQADTASVTREFVKHGINLLVPQYQDLSNIQSGKDNPQGYRMVEFPILNAVTAVLIQVFHVQKYEVIVGRLVSVMYSLVALVAIYGIARFWSGKKAAVASALAFAVLPFSVYYSRTILPDVPFIACLSVAIAALSYWSKNKHAGLFWLGTLSFAEALLHKPYGLFFLPLFAYLFFQAKKWKILTSWQSYVFGVVSIAPLAAWRWWIQWFPEGIPASDWLFNKDNIRLSGAFFHWIFEVRISILILGIGLIVPVLFALIKKGKDLWFYWIWVACLLAYAVVIAGGNVQHDYYQIIFLPFLCVAIGRGFAALYHLQPKTISRPTFWISSIALGVFSLFVSWYNVRGYFNVNHWEIVEAGAAVDKILPPDARVIASFNGDTSFLYAINRRGWPIGFEVDKKIAAGAQYYVSTSMDDETKMLMKQYVVLEKNPKFVVIDLQKKGQ